MPRFFWLKFFTATWLIAMIAGHIYVALATSERWWPYSVVSDPAALSMWAYTFAAGGLGATLYAMRGFYQAAGPQVPSNTKYQYDPAWTWWYIIRPLIGGPMGIVSYVAARVVLTPLDVEAPRTEGARLSFAAIAFLGGYSASRLLDWLTRYGRSLFPDD